MSRSATVRSGAAIGWDLGGAHLKAALFDHGGVLIRVRQLPMPLWRGAEHLDTAIGLLAREWSLAEYDHYMTMTGELVDAFENREQGVSQLVRSAAALLPAARLWLYAGPEGFVSVDESVRFHQQIASANWHATATWLAGRQSYGLLVDIGSTTSDILPFADGRVKHLGYSDRTRLAHDELVYTGVVRTPVMAVVQQVPFAGDWLGVANEHFATMADVYRVLDCLPASSDLHDTADGRDKGERASMRRLARMLGTDLDAGDSRDWFNLAAFIMDRQIDTLCMACHRQISKGLPSGAPLIGAGVGRFLVKRLAQRLDRTYVDIDDCFARPSWGGMPAADCAPAVAVALLAQRESVACAC